MQIEVMEHFGIKKYFRDADFFETDTAKRLFRQLKKIIPEGQLIALTGVVGIGKTTYLEKIQKQLQEDIQSATDAFDRGSLKPGANKRTIRFFNELRASGAAQRARRETITE